MLSTKILVKNILIPKTFCPNKMLFQKIISVEKILLKTECWSPKECSKQTELGQAHLEPELDFNQFVLNWWTVPNHYHPLSTRSKNFQLPYPAKYYLLPPTILCHQKVTPATINHSLSLFTTPKLIYKSAICQYKAIYITPFWTELAN